jgi:hypothetical protein
MAASELTYVFACMMFFRHRVLACLRGLCLHDHCAHSARNFAANTRSIEDAQTDATFRQRFNLPATEFPIISTDDRVPFVFPCALVSSHKSPLAGYYCCHKHIYHGWLYITPAYVCFEPALLSKGTTSLLGPALFSYALRLLGSPV